MKITRDVIYDLLPAYFANEVTADTRALIEEFFGTDPEFGRMAGRFRALLEEKRGDATVLPSAAQVADIATFGTETSPPAVS